MAAFVLMIQNRRVLSLIVIASIFAFINGSGCAGDYSSQYDESISNEDYVKAKALMKQQIEEYSYRDYNPTLPARFARSLYRLAYAHGKLAEYDSMKSALNGSAGHDPELTKACQSMTEYFAVERYNASAEAYNKGDFERALKELRTSLSIIGTDPPHEARAGRTLSAIGCTEAAKGEIDHAMADYKKAAALGDEGARKALEEFQKEKTFKQPAKLDKLEKPPLNL